ncbi:NAD(P)/FAD-dependent oxidoreductase [Psychrobacillus sp. NPDC093180]|uniref:NAD(P)/FAD-dependent oxidoreductase n=1 Tax=Psychrobacillus sp. NPDC093180 TaxID=3364489 RepID=UPI00381736F0
MKQDVIVVGGGIIGAAITYFLAKQGISVTLIEGTDIAAGTSSSCDQAVLLQTKKPGPLLELAIQSNEIYKSLEEELEESIEYRQGGGMILMENEQHKIMLEELVKKQNKVGLKVRTVSREEIIEKQPGLAPHIIGSTWSDEDAKVNSLKTSLSFVRAAKRFKASVLLGKPVQSLILDNNRVIGVSLKDENLYAESIIVAAGVWTPKLLDSLNVHVPIVPRRGQILVTEKLPPMFNANILSGAYIAAKSGATGESNNPYGVGLVMGQTVSGNVLIGGSREFVGFDVSTSPEVIRMIGNAAVHVFPHLKDVKIIRTFAGLRPYTPDSLPIMSNVPKYPGLYICAGHEGDGIALAPISGKIMADLLCGLPSSLELSSFSLERFKGAVAHA